MKKITNHLLFYSKWAQSWPQHLYREFLQNTVYLKHQQCLISVTNTSEVCVCVCHDAVLKCPRGFLNSCWRSNAGVCFALQRLLMERCLCVCSSEGSLQEGDWRRADAPRALQMRVIWARGHPYYWVSMRSFSMQKIIFLLHRALTEHNTALIKMLWKEPHKSFWCFSFLLETWVEKQTF